jgi:hypothetical protein
MRNRLIFALSVSLLVTPILPAHAEPKLGAVCKRESDIAHMPSGILICTKVGKTLKYISGNANAAGSAATAIPDKDVDPTVLKIYKNYNHAACKEKHPNFTATYLSSPTYKPAMLAQQKVLFEQAMSCYNGYFDHNVTINIAVLTESDYEFLASQMTNGVATFDAIQLRWAKFMMERLASGAGRFAGSAGWNVATNSAWVLMIDSSKSAMPDAHGAAHEFVHILQSYSKSGFFPYYGDGSSDADYLNVPNWFWEGTAELFSYASISSSAGIFSAQMAQARTQANGAPSLKKIANATEVITTIKKLGAPSNQEANSMMYALGSVVCEYLLATYGYAKYWQIMQNAGTYKDFSENLKATIGVTQDEFFAKAAPFVFSQWKLSKF